MNNNQIFVFFLASALTFARLNQDNSNGLINSLVNTSLIALGMGAYFYFNNSRQRQVAHPFGGNNNQPQQQPQLQPQPFPQQQPQPLLPGGRMPAAA